ncbi:lipopolysaccharide heptosyltransferase II [soil metagenome]
MAQVWNRTPQKVVALAVIAQGVRLLAPLLDIGLRREQKHVPSPHLLVLEFGNIGDIVLLTPFLAELRSFFPGCSITLLAKANACEVLQGTGLVDDYLEAERLLPRQGSSYDLRGYDWKAVRAAVAQLRERRFDVAFQCRLHIREHVLLRVSGSRRTVGCAFGTGDRLVTDRVRYDDVNRHKARDWLDLLEPFGGSQTVPQPQLSVSAEEHSRAREFLAQAGVLPGERVVGIHPGASLPEKRWPVERFTAVADRIAEYPGVRVIGFIDPEGHGAELLRNRAVIGARTNLRQLLALLDQSSLLVCNDSGPMHFAAAAGVPTVALFGLGDPRWFGPVGSAHRVLVAPAGDLRNIPVADVMTAVDEVLAVTPPGSNAVRSD